MNPIHCTVCGVLPNVLFNDPQNDLNASEANKPYTYIMSLWQIRLSEVKVKFILYYTVLFKRNETASGPCKFVYNFFL